MYLVGVMHHIAVCVLCLGAYGLCVRLCGLLNADTVSVWVTVCCSLSGNRLQVEGGKAIAAAMQHTPNMKSLE